MSKTPYVAAAVVLAGAAIAIVAVLPAETGWDPTGLGAKLGLTEIADPVSEEFLRGQARMEQQEVLTLSDAPAAPAGGYTDAWTYELAPFDSIEFKYTIAEGQPMQFEWEGTGPLHYDMHAHPFEGGTEMTESYGIGDAVRVGGTYTPAFSGIHGWFWENRSMNTVTLTLRASGGMTNSTVFTTAGEIDRPLAGVDPGEQQVVEGHTMQTGEEAAPAE